MPNTYFQESLKSWYKRSKRDLPWRNSDDPYRIWLSEIILQQTRVAQGLPYYQRFVDKYPNVEALATAPLDDVLKLWEGLGYYSRARNMHAAANYVLEEREGNFPTSYKQLLKLKGVGEYTAAAVSSFSANEAQAVVDGNVYRVLARYFGVEEPINSTNGKKVFAKLALEVLDKNNPAEHNQAIMEFGALQCKPKSPLCGQCPLQEKCYAYAENKVDILPVKLRKKYDRHRYFYFFVVEKNGKLLIEQRQSKDIWKGLFQFPMIEFSTETSLPRALEEGRAQYGWSGELLLQSEPLKPHKLSHQTIHPTLLKIRLESNMELESEEQRWVAPQELETFAFPKPLRQYLDGNQLTLPFS